MATIDQLNNEVRAMQKKIDDWETQLTGILLQGSEGMNAEQKRDADAKIEFFSERIRANDTLILEKDKQITADKQKDAADKEYRLKRGEQPLHR